LYGGLAFAGASMIFSAMLVMFLPKKSHDLAPAGVEAIP
jgi:hypothetical protein